MSEHLAVSLEEATKRGYMKETLEFIERLVADPALEALCVHGDLEKAVGLYEVPGGCVALPGLEVQTLCPQHVISDGSFEGMLPIIDLTLNGVWGDQSETQFDMGLTWDEGDVLLFWNNYLELHS